MPHSIPKDLRDANAPELLPCPFCGGGNPYLANVEMLGCAYVVCTDCGAQSDDGGAERVRLKWNSRADQPTLATENALLRNALRWVAASSGCQASRIIAAAVLEGTNT
jgi:hypothetical protein